MIEMGTVILTMTQLSAWPRRMSIWSLCTRPILLGCKHTCFCEKSDSPFLWMIFERWSSESRIGCTYSPLHRTFHTSPPPYTSSVRHKTMGVCWQFSNTHLLHHWSPLPPSVLPTLKGRISRPQVLPCLIAFNRICRKLSWNQSVHSPRLSTAKTFVSPCNVSNELLCLTVLTISSLNKAILGLW